MNRVTIINLAGRAWHVEEAGVQSLDAWLDDARTRLAGDPDRDELVLDFERAIADRFRHVAADDRDVVTAASVTDVLAALGTVEPAHEEPDATSDATTADTITTAAAPADGEARPGWRERRLYRLTGDDAILAGVCSGLAAYLRVDVTVVRVSVVLLTVLTSGALIIAYIAMALIVPEATSPEDRAEALGTGTTAQEMLARARAGASPALASLGSLISRGARGLVVVTRWLLLTAIWALLVAWAIAIGWIAIEPGPLLELFDDGTSSWLLALWVTCIAWLPIALLLAIERALATIRREPGRRSRPTTIALSSAWVVSVVAAVLGVFAIPAAYSSELSNLAADGRARITIGDEVYCVELDGPRGPNVDCPF